MYYGKGKQKRLLGRDISIKGGWTVWEMVEIAWFWAFLGVLEKVEIRARIDLKNTPKIPRKWKD